MIEPRYYYALTTRVDWYVAANFSFGFIRHVDTVAAPYSMLATVGADVYTDSARHFTIGLGISVGYFWNVTRIRAYSGQNFNGDVYSSNGHVFGLEADSWRSAARLDIGWAW